MHFIESGTGIPLVLLHAFPVDARMWNDARALLDEHARVITPDQRGLGETALAADGSEVDEPSLDLAAQDVVALLDTLGLDRVVLGGCSMGGYVAMAVLRAAPERVHGLLLVDTKGVADDAEQRAARFAAADRADAEGTEGWLAEGSMPALLGDTTHGHRPEVVARVRELIDTQPPSGVSWSQRAMAARPDSLAVLGRFDGPALVVVGDQDTLSPQAQAEELVAALPAGELAVLPGVGHLSAVEDPAAFADVVRPWLDRFDG